MTSTVLTPKQQRFAEEYLIDFNATRAAIRAGYSKKGADVAGVRLLGNASVQAEIQVGRDQMTERAQLTADRVLKELSSIAFSDPRSVASWGPDGMQLTPSGELTADQAAAIESIALTEPTGDSNGSRSVKFKMHNKLGALTALAKYVGVDQPRPTYEQVLDSMPPRFAEEVRECIQQEVAGGFNVDSPRESKGA